MNSLTLFQQGDAVYFTYKYRHYEGIYRGRRHSKAIILTADGTRWYIKKEKVRPKGGYVPVKVPRLDPVAETSVGVVSFS